MYLLIFKHKERQYNLQICIQVHIQVVWMKYRRSKKAVLTVLSLLPWLPHVCSLYVIPCFFQTSLILFPYFFPHFFHTSTVSLSFMFLKTSPQIIYTSIMLVPYFYSSHVLCRYCTYFSYSTLLHYSHFSSSYIKN